MATITGRTNRQGELLGWQGQVRRRGYPVQTCTFRTFRDAEVWAATIESEIGRGVFVARAEAEATTLCDALARYRAEVTPHKRGAEQERSRIAAWQRHPLGRRCLATIRGKDIASYIREREAGGVGANTIRLELAVISHLFAVARSRWGMESLSNPVQVVRGARPRLPHGRDRRLLAGEEPRLLAACAAYGGTVSDTVVIALATAMRRGEIAGMRWEHVDRAARVLLVPVTKTGGPRRVPLSSRALSVLDGLARRSDGYVWGIRADSITQAFTRAVAAGRRAYEDECAAAGETPAPRMLAGLRFHDLRHEATSRLFERGLNPMEVSAITGHKTLQMLKRYTHLRAEDLVDKLG